MFHYPFNPSELSETAKLWWDLFGFYLAVALILGAVIYASLVLIPVLYSRSRKSVDEIKPGVVPGDRGKTLYLAMIVLLIIAAFMSIFVESYISVNKLASLIEDEYGVNVDNLEQLQPGEVDGALIIEVRAFQWGWTFIYPNGVESDVLYLPEDRLVIFKVTSDDVFHAFAIPDLRVKIDAIPGQVNTSWTIPEKPGTYRIQCYELCGVGHAEMITKAVVLPQDLFDFWYKSMGEELKGLEGKG